MCATNIHSKIALIAGMALTLTACIKEDEPLMSRESTEAVTVQLSVNTGAMSRAAEVDPGDDEKKIYSLRVYVFTKDGKKAGHFYTENADGNIPAPLYMDMVVYSEPEQEVRFYVVANEDAVVVPSTSTSTSTSFEWTADLTEAQINDYYFTSVGSSIKTKGLPMYCKTDVITIDTSKGEVITEEKSEHYNHFKLDQTVSILLERPVGKLELFAAKETGETATLTITSAQILSQGQTLRNYMMPQGVNLKGKELQWGMSGVAYSLLPSETTGTTVSATLAEGDDRSDMSKYTALMSTPYYANENPYGSTNWAEPGTNDGDATKGNILVVTYKLGNEDEATGTVYLPPIERNRYYAVMCLIKSAAAGGMSIEYSVADWDVAQDDWNMDFTYPTYTNPIVPFNEGLEDDYKNVESNGKYAQPEVSIKNVLTDSDGDGVVDYEWENWQDDGTYRFKFQISAPEGMECTPTLTATGFHLDVFKKTTTGGYEYVETGKLTADEDANVYYVLVVRAVDPQGSSGDHATSTDLKITYDTSTWQFAAAASLLMINGSSGDTKWEGSEDPEVITIEYVVETE